MDSLVALCLVLSFTYFNLHGYLILIIPWPREQDHVYYTFDFVTALHSVLFFFFWISQPLSEQRVTDFHSLQGGLAWVSEHGFKMPGFQMLPTSDILYLLGTHFSSSIKRK